jgi:hypothetical protein
VAAAGPAHLTPRGFTNVLGVVKITIFITESFAVLQSLLVGVRRECSFFLVCIIKIRRTKKMLVRLKLVYQKTIKQNEDATRQQQVRTSLYSISMCLSQSVRTIADKEFDHPKGKKM